MTSPSSVKPLFSDLRGVTVRNTFLEFEDVGMDNFPESGFARQASEPAKPFNRQVSEQTTTGSGATAEEISTPPEESYSQLASYLSSALPPVVGADRRGGRARPPANGVTGSSLQAALQTSVATSASQMPPRESQSQTGTMRFCPNCGAEVEPTHRFCPYCRYPLQGGGAPGAGAQQQCSQPAQVERAVAASSAPNLLAYLRRFRYVEVRDSDVELARVLCLNFMQTGRAS